MSERLSAMIFKVILPVLAISFMVLFCYPVCGVGQERGKLCGQEEMQAPYNLSGGVEWEGRQESQIQQR